MLEIIKDNPDLKLALEFWPAGLSLAGSDPLRLLQQLEQQGFYLYPINKRQAQSFHKQHKLIPATSAQILAAGNTDLICSRSPL